MNDYKAKHDLPDLYDYLGLTIDVCKDPKCDEIIKSAYVRKARACHPDKHPGRKEAEEVFRLITESYEILQDEKQRNAYNRKLNLEKQSCSSFGNLKKHAQEYTAPEYTPATDEQKLTFKEHMKTLDTKHGFDSSQSGNISQQEAKLKMSELSRIRADQDRIFKPDRLFDDGRFDLIRFNAAFDKAHKKDETTLMPHTSPAAWSTSTAGYSNLEDVETLYDEVHKDGLNYSTTDFGTCATKLSKNDIIDLTGGDYVNNHNVISDDYYQNLKERLRNRETEATNIDSMKYNDYKRDDGGYGIFDKLGFKYDDRLSLDIDEESISSKYDKLVSERQK